MSSLVEAPVQAAMVAPAWRRSWRVMWVNPVASRAAVQERCRVMRRVGSPPLTDEYPGAGGSLCEPA